MHAYDEHEITVDEGHFDLEFWLDIHTKPTHVCGVFTMVDGAGWLAEDWAPDNVMERFIQIRLWKCGDFPSRVVGGSIWVFEAEILTEISG